jgi:hypothetical protein
MKTAILILATLISLTAHAEMEKSATDFYSIKSLRNTKSVVDIIRTDNVPATCEAESKRRGYGGFRGASMEACSFSDENKCTIVTGYVTNNDILGHELHHCFAGHFH